MVKPPNKTSSGAELPKERIAKRLSRAGVASRRESERMIEAGRVSVNGRVLTTAAFTVTARDTIEVDGKPLAAKEPPKLWRYHKPPGLITTHSDDRGRKTVFETLPKDLGRVISVGRLDLTSEGLLLLTNDGELARQLELPSTGFSRRYRARAYGRTTQERLDTLKAGIEIDGVKTGPIEATLESAKGDNVWVEVMIREGKNREVRRALETLDLKVNRLIRTSYGPFQLLSLKRGAVEEVRSKSLRDQLGHLVDIPEEPTPKRRPPKRGSHASAKRNQPGARDNAKRPPPKKSQGGRRSGPPKGRKPGFKPGKGRV